MPTRPPSLAQFWKEGGFKPNEQQEQAILHTDGPLYLPAGPGSGKTRVLLWRTLNLIVYHDVKPQEIYLSTFTEKAALQLKEGLRLLLGLVTNATGQPYDISQMYVGTVHSLCQKLILDRRLYPHRQRGKLPSLLDELGQYFLFYNPRTGTWKALTSGAGFGEEPTIEINSLFPGRGNAYPSRHLAITNCINLFNRLTEECIDPATVRDKVDNETLGKLLDMYAQYCATLRPETPPQLTDFSMLQQDALRVLEEHAEATRVFKHVIIDEYQDTNTVQERIFFRLAQGSHNLCVVGDDDQALYRFRGATVENFVDFPERCQQYLHRDPTEIPLATNYRSRSAIVGFYSDFIKHCDWKKPGKRGAQYRVASKVIKPNRTESGVAVVATRPAKPEIACAEIADLVHDLLQRNIVEDPSQIAFLFPSLKSKAVEAMQKALEAKGMLVYAPRAKCFLEVQEAVDLFGVFLHVFGKPEKHEYGGDYATYHDWIDKAHQRARVLFDQDAVLERFVDDRKAMLGRATSDWDALMEVVTKKGWERAMPYALSMKRELLRAKNLSDTALRNLNSVPFERAITRRLGTENAYSLNYILTHTTSIDWNVLDLFYQVCGFKHFIEMFDKAERIKNRDEGPICNLGLISQYLSRFVDQYAQVIRAERLKDGRFVSDFFSSYLYALYKRGESEFEDADDPFPRGRIPFLTIHQSKGLEFPVVVLGTTRKENHHTQRVEELVHPFLQREGEPLDRIVEFDRMRKYYVALSRAANLLVIAHYRGQGYPVDDVFSALLDDNFPRIPDLNTATIPPSKLEDDDKPRSYSYTSDYLLYQRCPRQYMIMRKYGFEASRSQSMVFGSLVHRTLDDLHQYLISQRSQSHA